MLGLSWGFGSFLRSLEWRSKEPLRLLRGDPLDPFGLAVNPNKPFWEPSNELVKGGRVAPASLFFFYCFGLSGISYLISTSSISIGNSFGLSSVLDLNLLVVFSRTGVC
jgi:hypothetical protein